MTFVAIDVETANAALGSICQIGVARFEGGNLVKEWKSLVDPEDYFDGMNISIHGIDESTVKGAPKFPALVDSLRSFLDGQVVVCHTHFDRVALHQASAKYGLPEPGCTWLDSARVARRAWKDCAHSGYGLHDVCARIGYEFRHHDALEDAKAAAEILLAASRECGLDLEGWLTRLRRPINPYSGTAIDISREGNPERARWRSLDARRRISPPRSVAQSRPASRKRRRCSSSATMTSRGWRATRSAPSNGRRKTSSGAASRFGSSRRRTSGEWWTLPRSRPGVSGGTAMADDGFEKMLGSLLPSVVGRLLEQDAALRAAVKDSAALQVRYAEHGPPMRASVRQRILENFRMSPLVQRRLSEGVPMERLFGGAARLALPSGDPLRGARHGARRPGDSQRQEGALRDKVRAERHPGDADGEVLGSLAADCGRRDHHFDAPALRRTPALGGNEGPPRREPRGVRIHRIEARVP